MRRFSYTIALAVILSGLTACQSPPVQQARRLASDIFLRPDTVTVEARVPRNATLPEVLLGHELPRELVASAVASVQEVFDVRRFRADQPYRLVRTLDGLFREFVYQIDRDRFLRVFRDGEGDVPTVTAEVVPYRKQRALIAVRGAIDEEHPSLIEAMTSAGEGLELGIALAELLGAELDFASDVQRGDEFEVLFEALYTDGARSGYGSIVAAEFVNDGRRIQAFRFVGADGKPGYYDAEGRSLRRFFLASPLRFAPQVTSGFSRRRLHPVLRTYRPHYGVDYRAPHGAPVVAVASGVVVSAAYSGASGRTVHLRHASGYESYYLHLSSFATGVRKGARVEQGQMIGRVGSSGLATGPHLDYRLKKDGRFINPLQAHRSLPPGEPIAESERPAFHATRALATSRLFAETPAVAVAAAEPVETVAQD